VVYQKFVFQIKFCGNNPALRVAAKRYGQAFDNAYEKILNKRMNY
jgi:hypothetical protein